MACEYSFDGGKTFISKEEFIEQLAKGKLDEFISQGIVDLGKVRGVGQKQTLTEEQEVNQVAEKVGISPKNLKDLYDINRKLFGLDRLKSLAAAITMDRMIGVMAKRAGVSKSEMYSKLNFQKSSEENIPQGTLLQVDAFHGSPYEFDKFTTQKIGTGEGAQAFGWGLYFTDLESIAKGYADKLTEHSVYINGKEVDTLKGTPLYDVSLFVFGSNNIAKEQGKESAIANLKQAIRDNRTDYNDAQKAIKYLEGLDSFSVKKDKRNLYKVSLHKGKTPEQYNWLEWDKPVNSKNVNILIAMINSLPKEEISDKVKTLLVSELSKESPSITGGNVYKYLSGFGLSKEGEKQTSLFLLENGIDGIKYPAESVARGATSDNARGFNYVVFDENAVSIKEVIKFQKDAEKARGAVMVSMDGQATIYALTDPNVSTPVHELAHVFEHYLTPEERQEVIKSTGTQGWTIETSERFARGFEKYLANGNAPTEGLKKVFQKFKQWLTDIYNGIKDSDIDIELNPKMEEIYAKMLGEDAVKKKKTPPPTPPKEEGKGDEEPFVQKMRSFYKSVIERATGLTTEQKELLKADPNALYNVLPVDESKRIAREVIEEIGVESAVLEASKSNSQFQPVEKVMILGAAMDYYAAEAKKAKTQEGFNKAADDEIDAQEKMLQVAAELGTLGTAYGRAINIFKEVYKLSSFALERKLKETVKKVNELKAPQANQQAKEIGKIISNEEGDVQDAAKDLTETQLMREADALRKVEELEKEVEALKKEILQRDNAAKGTKKNPLKIKRVTNDTEYDKRVKEFKQRQRSIISKDDVTDLTYFGLYHIENGLTKFADWYNVMDKNFKGFKDKLGDIYRNARDKAIENGADKTIFDDDKVLSEFKSAQYNEKLENLKGFVKEKIETVRKQIIEKDQKKKELKENFVEDLELERLKDELYDLEELRDKYIPELPEDFETERKRERFKDNLVKQIIDLNEQINAGVKRQKESKEKYEDDKEINKLRKIKKSKEDILEKITGLSEEEKKSLSDAKKMALATKRAAIAKFNEAMANNPDRARVLAPRIAAERVRRDAARNLDMPSTEKEQTYLKKLVQVVNQKAKEYYKEKSQKISNINDILAFAIANGKSDYAIWERTQQEVQKQIDEDTSLTDEQKQEVKDFLSDYQESIFDTLMTEKQIDQLVREKLIEAGYSIEKTVNGKVVKSIDWSKIIGSAKTIKEAREKIAKAITSLGFTEQQAKGEIDAAIQAFDSKVADKKEKDINAFLNKSVLNKAKSALGVKKKVPKNKISQMIEMNNKGMLDNEKIKDVLAEELGLIELTKEDIDKIKELAELIEDESIPRYMKRQFEEQMQYLFDSKSGNVDYLENREAVTNNRLSSAYNQFQNATGFFRTFTTALTQAIKTQSPIQIAKVFGKEFINSWADAKSILIKGRVSRGSAFSDLTRVTEGEPRVRFLEYGKGKFLGGKFLGKTLYAKIGGKTVDLNPLNQAYERIKYIQRLLETVDTFSSSVVSGLTQYGQVKNQVDRFYPELSSKEKAKKVWDMMYSLDRTKEIDVAIKGLKKAGIENPTKYEINRAINEKVERERNKIISDEFYKNVESLKPMAETKLKGEGNNNPTPEQIQEEAYKMLGYDEPLDVVARGERQAGRETGKTSTFGITSALLLPIDGIQAIVRKVGSSKTPTATKVSNTLDFTMSQLFPFVHSIARWTEMQLELTPYGFVKGVVYKTGLPKQFEGKAKIPMQEYKELGDDFMIRSVLGAGYTALGMFAISFAKNLAGDEDEAEEAIKGTSKDEMFTKERVKSVGQPKQSVKIGDTNLPLQILGNEGFVLGMYSDFNSMKKDPEMKEKGSLYIAVLVTMNAIIDATWASNASKYGGIATSIFKGKEEKYEPALGRIVGSFIGSQIPFNRLQTEAATVLNPQSKQSVDFGVNVLNQMSIVRAFGLGKPSFDYRGRTYEYGDIYVNSADGIFKMFKKSKYGDDADRFLSEINFAATDAYRETKDAENYKYAITEKDGTKRFMTNDEYYDFKLKAASKFDELIKKKYQAISKQKIKINGVIDESETQKVKKKIASLLLDFSKKTAFIEIQKKTGFTPTELKDKNAKEKKEDIKEQVDEISELLGIEDMKEIIDDSFFNK